MRAAAVQREKLGENCARVVSESEEGPSLGSAVPGPPAAGAVLNAAAGGSTQRPTGEGDLPSLTSASAWSGARPE
jgi:hypothetical protein